MDALGRRVERLLYLSAPISFAAFVILFIALALDSNEGRFSQSCHSKLLAAFETNDAELKTLFLNKMRNKKPSSKYPSLTDYHLLIIDVLVHDGSYGKCRALTLEYSTRYSIMSPEEIGVDLRKKIKESKIERLSYLGTELPEKATIDVFGTKVLVELQVFITLLQLVLAPVMLLWLGSLLNSRAAEITRIVPLSDPTKVFPHVINTYAGRISLPAGKRGFLQRYLPKVFVIVGPALHSLSESMTYFRPASFRVFFVGIVVIPPTAAFIYSLYLVRIVGYDLIYFVVGILVGTFGLLPLLLEILPVIYRKRFEYESLRKFLGDRTL